MATHNPTHNHLTLKQLMSDQSLTSVMQQLETQIKQRPTDAGLRWQLYQILCLMGDWQRGLRQLQLYAQMLPEFEPNAQVYRGLIRCELFRQECLLGKRRPNFVLAPPPWVEQMLEAIAHHARGDENSADKLRLQALNTAVGISGIATPGGEFEWISDSDTWLGPVVEAVIGGQYSWIPFEQIQRIDSSLPHTLLDLIWKPATFTLIEGTHHSAYLLTRDGDATLIDDTLRLCRKTIWHEHGQTSVRAQGQKTWQTNRSDCGVLDITACVFTQPPQTRPLELSNG